MQSVMAVIGCQLDYVWNELQCRSGGQTRERFPAWFEVGESTSSLDLRARKTHGKAGKALPLIWATLSAGSLHKDVGEGSV